MKYLTFSVKLSTLHADSFHRPIKPHPLARLLKSLQMFVKSLFLLVIGLTLFCNNMALPRGYFAPLRHFAAYVIIIIEKIINQGFDDLSGVDYLPPIIISFLVSWSRLCSLSGES